MSKRELGSSPILCPYAITKGYSSILRVYFTFFKTPARPKIVYPQVYFGTGSLRQQGALQ
jgi:hypothetical protein